MFGVTQKSMAMTPGKVKLKELTAPPLVDVDVDLTPKQKAKVAALRVSDEGLNEQGTYGPPVTPLPYRLRLPAGVYLVEGVVAGSDPKPRLCQAKWPRSRWPVEA
jgi:hypothetical protein